MHQWHIHADAQTVAQAAADYLAEQLRDMVDARGVCHVALPGGTTPAVCLRLLAAKSLPWDRIHWYLGDERCLPLGDAERNDTMIREQLWSRAAIPAANCHPIPADLGADKAAAAYSKLLASVGRLDIALLGMGEDGHTASLFPDNPALALTAPAVPVFDSPKPPPQRVSLSRAELGDARLRLVLITGAGKRYAVARIRAGEALPVNQLGPLQIFCDEAAAGA